MEKDQKEKLVQVWVYKSDRTKINIKRASKGQSQPEYIKELMK